MKRVLVTRPEPGAGRTAARLRERGFEPVVLPLSETRVLPVVLETRPETISALLVTSANAVRHAPADMLAQLADLPCHVVGPKTADAARAAGLSVVETGSGDAGQLAEQIAPALAGKTAAYLCGRVRSADFEAYLAGKAVTVLPIETYDTLPVDYPGKVAATHLAGQPVAAVLLYSAKAAQAYSTLVQRPELARYFEETRVLALSVRVASAVSAGFPGRLVVATRPDEDALLALLGTAE
ncbi:MAG: uroporphyrinogen-III synthase [Aquamicrobium sp.]|uniref:uroporphyrinogen-III synthase n=1 Tax=Mesorhizobium sp. Pch-S TaxID=2082387 RepID=UPI0010109560|nr:uroporphyrinogen-III synthase [Mesorhizobium sp. Pch-S]MBR2690642.1 uroporphyrinogen-III synthase [Aquamicrobium sp.]QAZ43647.1 uroporphyrinogen III synthase [Mesorhizobium sp. Pch-S]